MFCLIGVPGSEGKLSAGGNRTSNINPNVPRLLSVATLHRERAVIKGHVARR